MVLSISAYQWREWYPEIGQMARTTEDIAAIVGGMSGVRAQFDGEISEELNNWGTLTVMQVAEENNKWAAKAKPNFWNDPDMLVTGDQGLSIEEQKSQFALWCIMSSPLMLGNDPRNMTEDERSILLNKDCIAVNQDSNGQGGLIIAKDQQEMWAKKLSNGDIAVLLLNRDTAQSHVIHFDLKLLGIDSKVMAIDLFTGKNLGDIEETIALKVEVAASLFLLLKTGS